MSTLAHLKEHKIVSIIRGANPNDVLSIANALYEGGVRCLEITLNSQNALQLIETLSVKLEGRLLIGAGTVLTREDAMNAIAAGAKFIISPITDFDTIYKTKELGVVSIPGAFTPTEIYKAFKAGGDIIKVFPGSSGAGFIKEILAPLPHIPLMPTGGITIDNIHQFKKAGVVAFGIGKSLVDTTQKLSDGYLTELITRSRRFIQAIAEANN